MAWEESDVEEQRRHERETYADPDVPGAGGSMCCAWCLGWFTPRDFRAHVTSCGRRPDALKEGVDRAIAEIENGEQGTPFRDLRRKQR